MSKKRTSIALNVSDYEKLRGAKEAFEDSWGSKMSWGAFLSMMAMAVLIGLELPEKESL